MGSLGLELGIRPTYIPRTIGRFLEHVSMIGDESEKASRIDDYVGSLQEEMRKIDAFKRELPLCFLLLNDAIAALKEEAVVCRKSSKPVLEEFIPLKRSCPGEDEKVKVKNENENGDKMNWMSSMQLWTSDFTITAQSSKEETKQRAKEEGNGHAKDDPFRSSNKNDADGALVTPKACTNFPLVMERKENREGISAMPGLSFNIHEVKNPKVHSGSGCFSSETSCGRGASSSAVRGQSNAQIGHQPQQQPASRKQRRCWSHELHQRFVKALERLGGSQAATPKQIRELMQVDGLTNDEVKSHLQKYRIHTKKVPAAHSNSPNQPVVIFGGLMVPQDQNSESTKGSNSQSGSPQGHLQLAGTSTTVGDSMEDEEDERSESHSYRNHSHNV